LRPPAAVVTPPDGGTTPVQTVDDRTVTAAAGEESVTVTANVIQQLASGNASLIVDTDDATVTLPTAVLSALTGGAVEVGVSVETAEDGSTSVSLSVTSGDNAITNFAAPVSVSVAIDVNEGENTNRYVAVLADGTLVGGSYDTATGEFTFETTVAGDFTIVYAEDMNRLVVNLGSTIITDLAGNAETVTMDVPPVIVEGRTLIPVRFIAEMLGGEVGWNDATREVTLTIDGRTLTFAIGEAAPGMDVPAQIIDGRTMVPLRFISEFFDAVVNWDDAARSIEIIRL
jgi:hypothetical protein